MFKKMIKKARDGDLEAVIRLQNGFKRDTGRHIIVKCTKDKVVIFEKFKDGREKELWKDHGNSKESHESLQNILNI
jgi:hypothetical protein